MMTLSQYKQFTDGARAAYLHACEKHPNYTNRLCHPNYTLDAVRFTLADAKEYNGEDGGNFNSILDEEIAEYIEASILGDKEKAKRELLDCVAVLMREWERISE